MKLKRDNEIIEFSVWDYDGPDIIKFKKLDEINVKRVILFYVEFMSTPSIDEYSDLCLEIYEEYGVEYCKNTFLEINEYIKDEDVIKIYDKYFEMFEYNDKKYFEVKHNLRNNDKDNSIVFRLKYVSNIIGE